MGRGETQNIWSKPFLPIYHSHTSLHISYSIKKKKEVAFPAQQERLGHAAAAFHTSFRVNSQKRKKKKKEKGKEKENKTPYYPVPSALPDYPV